MLLCHYLLHTLQLGKQFIIVVVSPIAALMYDQVISMSECSLTYPDCFWGEGSGAMPMCGLCRDPHIKGGHNCIPHLASPGNHPSTTTTVSDKQVCDRPLLLQQHTGIYIHASGQGIPTRGIHRLEPFIGVHDTCHGLVNCYVRVIVHISDTSMSLSPILSTGSLNFILCCLLGIACL